jgi:hypothetical protein
MTLRDRLEQAKAERRQAAGLPAEPPPVSPMDQPIGSREQTDEAAGSAGSSTDDRDYSIDLTGFAPVVDLRPDLRDPSNEPRFSGALAVGEGDRCPMCASPGALDMEDVVGGVDHYSCTNCGLLYQVART